MSKNSIYLVTYNDNETNETTPFAAFENETKAEQVAESLNYDIGNQGFFFVQHVRFYESKKNR